MTKTEYALRTLWKRCVSMAFFFSCGCLWQNPVFIVEESEKMNSKHRKRVPTSVFCPPCAAAASAELLVGKYPKPSDFPLTTYNTAQGDFAEVLREIFQKLFLLPTTEKNENAKAKNKCQVDMKL